MFLALPVTMEADKFLLTATCVNKTDEADESVLLDSAVKDNSKIV